MRELKRDNVLVSSHQITYLMKLIKDHRVLAQEVHQGIERLLKMDIMATLLDIVVVSAEGVALTVLFRI